ncbi:hypothetical protein [Rhizobium sp.]|jgi:hypothetical protein|uniref:hypothetical protein n=1 Tax=Rhizobium sp. TaxID=391 RepID=UPI000E8F7E22|nr:hypothetical protein [Rhizobium sp.]
MQFDKANVQAAATLLFGVLGATISVLTWKGDHDAYCVSSVQTFIDVSRKAYLSLPSDHYTNPLMRRIVRDCDFKAEELLQLMGSGVQQVAKVDVDLQSPADSEKAAKTHQKWVSLGIAGGASNFSVVGSATMAQWKQGDQLTALDDVNVRPNFANWSAPLEVITKGEVVTLAAEPVEVPDGEAKQYWGRLR